MNKLIGLFLVAGMAGTFFVLAVQVTGALQFIANVWGVFLCITIINQILRKK